MMISKQTLPRNRRRLARAAMEALDRRVLMAQSIYAFPGADGIMLYMPQPLGDKIGDYSNVGYMGGTMPIPNVPVKLTLTEAPGDTTDDTARIQAAIDDVENDSIDANGFRGAVVLGPGEWEISTGLVINSSGVVLRGS